MNAPAQIRANSARDDAFSHFDLTPATPILGAYLSGLNLAEVTEAAAEDVRAALWRYGVLFLRDQHLTPEQLTAAGYLFGPQLEEHTFGKTMADEGHPEVLVIEQMQSDRAKTTTDIWHHDVTARKNPNLVSVLQASEVPFGADTMWTSAAAAFEWLPDALKVLFLSLDVEHDTAYMALRHDFAPADKLADLVALGESAIHPAVIRHPFNDRLCLFVGNGYTKRIHGYSAEQGEHLIKLAIEQAKIPEIQVRFQWQPGDIAIWDNLGTLHYGVTGDLRNQKRLLHRVAAWSPDIRPSLDREAAISAVMAS
jgi:taurine dioxygenase